MKRERSRKEKRDVLQRLLLFSSVALGVSGLICFCLVPFGGDTLLKGLGYLGLSLLFAVIFRQGRLGSRGDEK